MADIYELARPAGGRRSGCGRGGRLFDRFNDAFWWEAEGTYYLGLDGAKRPIRVGRVERRAPAQSGIVPPERAGGSCERLLRRRHVVGLGDPDAVVRPRRVQPVQLPHGLGLAARQRDDRGGLRRYGYAAEAAQVAKGIFDAAERFVANRLPELFAGLPRQRGSFPVQYLGANVPQAWAAGVDLPARSRSWRGSTPRSDADRLRLFVDPALPDWLPRVTISNLRAGPGRLTLAFEDGEVEVGVEHDRVRGRPRPGAAAGSTAAWALATRVAVGTSLPTRERSSGFSP